MEKIVLIAHGSPKDEANHSEIIKKNLASSLGIDEKYIIVAYLKFGFPLAEDAIKNCIDEGAKRIIIHPFFLHSGSHVTVDIPRIIEKLRKLYPQVNFICTKPIGFHDRLADLIKDLVIEAKNRT